MLMIVIKKTRQSNKKPQYKNTLVYSVLYGGKNVFYTQINLFFRCEEMQVLDIKTPERPRSASPKQSLLELWITTAETQL